MVLEMYKGLFCFHGQASPNFAHNLRDDNWVNMGSEHSESIRMQYVSNIVEEVYNEYEMPEC